MFYLSDYNQADFSRIKVAKKISKDLIYHLGLEGAIASGIYGVNKLRKIRKKNK